MRRAGGWPPGWSEKDALEGYAGTAFVEEEEHPGAGTLLCRQRGHAMNRSLSQGRNSGLETRAKDEAVSMSLRGSRPAAPSQEAAGLTSV